MSLPRLVASMLLMLLALSGPTWAGTCSICDCNNNRSVCAMQCQQQYSDYSKRLNCEVSCTKTYASCVDTAYQTARAEQEAAQQSTSASTTTTGSGSTTSGS